MIDKNNVTSGPHKIETSALSAVFLALALFVVFAGAAYLAFYPRNANLGVEAERVKLAASAIVQFSEVVQSAVQRLKDQGIRPEDMDFSIEGMEKNAVFSSKGGGVTYRAAQQGGLITGKWEFKVPVAGQGGWYISGIGSDLAGGEDIFMTLQGIAEDVCSEINRRLGRGGDILAQRIPVDFAEPSGAGAVSAAAVISALPGVTAACVKNGNAAENYFFYRVLAAH